MHGHALAFEQLGQLPGKTRAFNAQFGDWLRKQLGISCSSGWAYAMASLSESKDDGLPQLSQLVESFLDQW